MKLLPAHPLLDAAADGSKYEAEVAVAQVKAEFLERAPHLDHRVHPSHDAVGTVAIGDVFDDVGRMMEK